MGTASGAMVACGLAHLLRGSGAHPVATADRSPSSAPGQMDDEPWFCAQMHDAGINDLDVHPGWGDGEPGCCE